MDLCKGYKIEPVGLSEFVFSTHYSLKVQLCNYNAK